MPQACLDKLKSWDGERRWKGAVNQPASADGTNANAEGAADVGRGKPTKSK